MNRHARSNDPTVSQPSNEGWWFPIFAALLPMMVLTVPLAPWLSDSDIASIATGDTISLVETLVARNESSTHVCSYARHCDDDRMAFDAVDAREGGHHLSLQLAWAPRIRP